MPRAAPAQAAAGLLVQAAEQRAEDCCEPSRAKRLMP